MRLHRYIPLIATLLVGCAQPSFSGPNWEDDTGYALYEEGDVYVVVATTIKPADQGAFSAQVDIVEQELLKQDGLVLYGFGGSFLRGTGQTLSVWRDYESVGTFLASDAHLDAVEAFEPTATDFATDIWEISGSDLPPSWDEADKRLAEILAE